MVEDSLRNEIIAAIPKLRAFAISLTGHSERADDLVQDTIVRAWGAIGQFERGTNLNAWLFTILRNLFLVLLRFCGERFGSYPASLSN